jgi:hypothetical protein
MSGGVSTAQWSRIAEQEHGGLSEREREDVRTGVVVAGIVDDEDFPPPPVGQMSADRLEHRADPRRVVPHRNDDTQIATISRRRHVACDGVVPSPSV